VDGVQCGDAVECVWAACVVVALADGGGGSGDCVDDGVLQTEVRAEGASRGGGGVKSEFGFPIFYARAKGFRRIRREAPMLRFGVCVRLWGASRVRIASKGGWVAATPTMMDRVAS